MASAPRKTIGTGPDAREFAFGTIPAEDALEVQLILFPIAGQVAASFALADSDASDADKQGAAIKNAMAAFKELNRKDVKDAMKLVLRHCALVGGGDITDINAVFYGKPLQLWEVFFEGMRVNFGPFFAAIRGHFQSLREKAKDSLQAT